MEMAYSEQEVTFEKKLICDENPQLSYKCYLEAMFKKIIK